MLLEELTEKIERVSDQYSKEFDIKCDDDWLMLKLQEEFGELVQSYLMLTGRARGKGLTQEEFVSNLKDELADVFSYVLILAKRHDIDLEKAVEDKWFQYLKD